MIKLSVYYYFWTGHALLNLGLAPGDVASNFLFGPTPQQTHFVCLYVSQSQQFSP